MSDTVINPIPLSSRAALAGIAPGRLGTSAGAPGVTLTALPEGYVLYLLARPFDAAADALAKGLAARLGVPLRPTAPGQWFVAGNNALSPGEMAGIAGELGHAVAVSEQSHGRVRVSVSGPKVEDLLAKLMAADLALPAFPVGHGTTLFAGHVSVHAQRMAEDTVELTVLRGFAVDLVESLVQSGLEFGIECQNPV